jgi:succinate dehydrogenase flavin-adding protein (antitoxin of CptAB toxin-antitoxin module)
VDPVELNRLQWKCRRGLLELDLVLQKFLATPVREADVPALNELLDLPDNELLDIVMGRSDRYASHLSQTVARLRAA